MLPRSRIFCVITGASRGFGRAVALALAEDYCQRSVKSMFVLVARSMDGLLETQRQMTSLKQNDPIGVHCVSGDLGDLTSLQETAQNIFDLVQSKEYSHALLVNNAGTIGNLTKFTRDHSDVNELSAYWNTNISSPIFLITQFLKVFKDVSCTVVNVSSLAAVEPLPCMSLYSTGKAARDMMHRVLAKEEPDVSVLNYAPGPLNTDMFEEICHTAADGNLKEQFNKMKQEGNVLSPDTSAQKLVVILKENKFTSGAHIDFFDGPPARPSVRCTQADGQCRCVNRR